MLKANQIVAPLESANQRLTPNLKTSLSGAGNSWINGRLQTVGLEMKYLKYQVFKWGPVRYFIIMSPKDKTVLSINLKSFVLQRILTILRRYFLTIYCKLLFISVNGNSYES